MRTVNKFTDNELLFPDEIANKLCDYLKEHDIIIGNNYDELYDSLYHLKTVCENPFNFEHFRILYDTISSIAETIKTEE